MDEAHGFRLFGCSVRWDEALSPPIVISPLVRYKWRRTAMASRRGLKTSVVAGGPSGWLPEVERRGRGV